MQPTLTTVATETVWVQGKLIVVFSDESCQEFTHYGQPTYLKSFVNLTKEQIIEKCRDHNYDHQQQCNIRLHNSKVARLGWDYRARGYR